MKCALRVMYCWRESMSTSSQPFGVRLGAAKLSASGLFEPGTFSFAAAAADDDDI